MSLFETPCERSNSLCLIVLADGDPVFLQLAAAYLEHCGHQVWPAPDCLVAIAAIRDTLPDLVILDSELLWGGWQGIRELMRDDLSLAEVPLLVFADHLNAETLSWNSRPSLNVWLRKPFRLQQLQAAIAASLTTPDGSVPASDQRTRDGLKSSH